MADFWDSWPVMLSPLYPRDGEAYDKAMRAAQEEYAEWERSKEFQRGITIYSRTPNTEEDAEYE